MSHAAAEPGAVTSEDHDRRLDLERLFALSADLWTVADGEGRLLRVNPAWETALGWAPEELEGRSFADLVHPDDLDATLRAVAPTLRGEGPLVGLENRYRTKDGEWRWFLWSASWDGRRCYGVAKDITERKALEAQALHDPLTGLPNRLVLLDRASLALRRDRRDATATALVFLDVDRFKAVNDTFGHAAGDGLLQAIARRLAEAVREGDTVARLGGDEFVVLLDRLDAPDPLERVLARIEAAFVPPFVVGGEPLVVGASVGVAYASGGEATAEDLLRHADIAMYRAKSAGGGTARFDEALGAETRTRIALAADLAGAVRDGELRLVFQPLVQLPERAVVGCEALLRWQHPERGLLGSAEFLELVDDGGHTEEVADWVLEQATAQARAWRRDGKDLTVSVNLSARQLASPTLAARVRRILARTGLPAEALCLEVTETALLRDPATAARTLGELRRAGARVALDDFGQGFSSLGHLKTLPVDVVKIDRAFVADVCRSREDAAIVRALVALAEEAGFALVAEGVEDEEQAARLTDLGVTLAQGFLFGRPAPAEQLEVRGFLPRPRRGLGDPFVIREFMRQIGIPARIER